MKKILLGLAVFGFASPALAHNGFVYVDGNNDIEVLVTGSEEILQNEDMLATGGKIDPAVKLPGLITICDGPGGAMADVLAISTNAFGKVQIELLTDPLVKGVCPKTLPPGDVNDKLCPHGKILGAASCDVTPLFPGAKDVEVRFN